MPHAHANSIACHLDWPSSHNSRHGSGLTSSSSNMVRAIALVRNPQKMLVDV
jgi:hypothetical protein